MVDNILWVAQTIAIAVSVMFAASPIAIWVYNHWSRIMEYLKRLDDTEGWR